MIHRIYIAGPYTDTSTERVLCNILNAARAGSLVMLRGHLAHVPHSATHDMAELEPTIPYEKWMALDESILRWWATGVLRIGSSPGADREVALARHLEIPVWFDIKDVPVP